MSRLFGEEEYDYFELPDDYGDEVFDEAYVYIDNETNGVRHDFVVDQPID